VSVGIAVERYARAIFELGVESGDVARLSQDLNDFAASYSATHELRTVLENPVVPERQRETVLLEVARRAGLSQLGLNALLLLFRRRRLALLPAITRRLRTLADEKSGTYRAKVTSAYSLPESYFSELKTRLEQMLGKRVVVEHEEDPTLIGGIITRVGDNTIDGSIAGRLEELERTLLAPV
jgi:F-type H+-transporting ATPase subunit delta